MNVACICVRVSTARTTSLNPACSGSAAKSARATSARRLVMTIPLADVRDPELPFERDELVEIDRADDVDECQLARLGGDDEQPRDRVAARVQIDIDVLFDLAAHGDHGLPRGPELRAHLLDDGTVVLPFFVEFVAVDVDALQLANEVLRRTLVWVAVIKEPRGEAEHRAVEGDVDRFAGAVGERGKVEVQPLRAKRSGECDEEDEERDLAHGAIPCQCEPLS